MMKKAFITLFSLLSVIYVFAQEDDDNYDTSGRELNAILTTVPFLTIAPDARAGAMGDAGAATSPDASSQHWNPAKYVFMKQKFGVDLAYTPWLQRLNIDDLNIVYLSGFYKFDDKQAVSLGIRYFNLGTIQYTNPLGQNIGIGNPNEFAIDVAYSRLFSEYFSGALAFRYILSDIAGGQAAVNNIEINKGQSWAADIALYYQRPIRVNDYEAEMAYGLDISNIGAKMSYSAGATKEFIPTNMRLGGRFSINLDEYNSIAATIDLNKLLVPTPPKMQDDSIVSGLSDEVGTITGIFQSFYDAPGYLNADDGTFSGTFKEELREIMISGGLEYWYRQQFAVRAGYFYENVDKGNRKFITTGVGLKLNVFTLDFSYLIATGRNSPLDRTMRFTLGFIF